MFVIKGGGKVKRSSKLIVFVLTVVIFITGLIPCASAKDFAPIFDGNIGVNTQYAYSESNVSWLRQLTVKEDMLSTDGIMSEAELIPVTDYPYTSDAPHFKAQVEESIKNYTLDKDSQRAAYLYLLNQIGALTIISEPTVSDQTKADWLRDQGIIITPEDEADAERVLMISALYAMMRNDLYYVYKGEHLEIPKGTPLEEALVKYIAALSGNDQSLASFMLKFFGTNKLMSLEDYIYYTSLMALYVNGYASVSEIARLERNEVYRRVAIMTIRGYGLSIDSETATQQELTDKYLTAMLGTHYKVSLDPSSLLKAQKTQGVPYYILQRMALEDSNVTISHTRYNYNQCFDIVLKKTDRFDLEHEFFSDIYEYDIHLEAKRKNISINPNPITAGTVVYINGKVVQAGKYAVVEILEKAKQTITIVTEHKVNGKTTKSTYKLNIYQGIKEPESSNLTGIIPTIGTPDNTPQDPNSPTNNLSLPAVSPLVSNVNNAAMNLMGNFLSVNENGQLVDQNGNIISQGNYEKLPDGYKYMVGDDGIIKVVFVDDTTQGNSSGGKGSLSEEDTRKIVILASSALCLLLVAMLVAILIISKKRGKNNPDAVRKRREKEKKKKARLEAKQSKKEKK